MIFRVFLWIEALQNDATLWWSSAVTHWIMCFSWLPVRLPLCRLKCPFYTHAAVKWPAPSLPQVWFMCWTVTSFIVVVWKFLLTSGEQTKVTVEFSSWRSVWALKGVLLACVSLLLETCSETVNLQEDESPNEQVVTSSVEIWITFKP